MKFDEQARDEAARWFAAIRRGPMSIEEQGEFNRWRADPAHQAALNAMHELWGEMATVGDHGVAIPNTRRVRRAFAAAAVALAVVGAGELYVAFQGMPFTPDRVATKIGEQRTATLADGSVISVNVATKLAYSMSDRSRRVDMREGEAAFFVRKDKTRPFLVRAGNYQVRAVGTAFNVRYRGGTVDVSVIEGVVSVTALKGSQAGQEVARLEAGRKVALAPSLEGVVPKPVGVAPQSIAEWRVRTLDYEDVPVMRIVDDLNLFFERPIRIDDPALAARHVTLRLQVEDRERALTTLAALLNLSVSEQEHEDVLSDGAARRANVRAAKNFPSG